MRPCEECAFYSGRPYAECEDCDDFNSMWKLKEKPIKGQRELIKKAIEVALDNHEVNQPCDFGHEFGDIVVWRREKKLFKDALTALEKEGL